MNIKKPSKDRQKILAWLGRIGETDQRCINEVLELCAKDVEARKYYADMADGKYEAIA